MAARSSSAGRWRAVRCGESMDAIIKRANLVAVIDHLESLDLVRRDPSATDRRSNRLQLTVAGERALKRAVDDQPKHEARITRLLGVAGRAALIKQLVKLCELGRT
jgi:DNA-binding MarR family transcriptional regulator